MDKNILLHNSQRSILVLIQPLFFTLQKLFYSGYLNNIKVDIIRGNLRRQLLVLILTKLKVNHFNL